MVFYRRRGCETGASMQNCRLRDHATTGAPPPVSELSKRAKYNISVFSEICGLASPGLFTYVCPSLWQLFITASIDMFSMNAGHGGWVAKRHTSPMSKHKA